ncbi:MAG: PEGA domain-containing protein [Bacteroidales bacterium]|nr:PEGA domain-containing protein [Bacteroidales bacterium]
MKKLFLHLLAILFCVPAFPQQLKKMHIIGQPQKLQSGEMVARRDQNGNYCAAIQVISDMSGFSYDSWDGIVGNIDSKPGKDMVFLTETERVLEVFIDGYKPLKVILSDKGINLQAREVWQITIAGDEAADVLPVTFRFTPEDAKLFIDGGDASGKLTQELSVGEHQVKLVRDGYQTIEKTINVNKEQVFFNWQMEEAPDAGLQISTDPSGAMIYLDGVKLGESPVAAFYPPGSYPITIRKEGFVSIENEMMEVKLPQTTKKYILEENVGYLTINTRDEATVYFNGEIMDDHSRVKLSPQLVQVKVSMPKADDLEQQVVIKKDDEIVLDMFPNIQTGIIQVAVTPFDANIELTGDAGEKYTAQGMKIFSNIPVGTYTLKVTVEGHKTIEEKMVLKTNEKLNKTVTLEEGSDGDYGIEMIF